VPIAGCCTLTAATGGHKAGAITIPGCRSNSPQVTHHNRHSAPNPRTSSRHERAFHRLAVLHNDADLIISRDAGLNLEPVA
jgi:hypothetical protein